ncbi:hypothetical protein GUITHDRAFT_114534 [Guillardia theta CCMP2712]|uniref:PH domain-containing protein n=1 Tax=Guillardia theta (strain CCMP2712) TaxID=905079 RepID=L1ISY8_GUITC|nr:hypothetical protein GUITHDRAFT_114534 [Guillardia theta CCMP2712]EKX39333.1 hypothetical protein GUITHDRAFT_114534 [Guillardia theta CCMP2712]|mmetsp:Transcript_38099/g.120035  ORF Transcript_38099/g.120035 Transcript_38099/m.120035 type:complete len:152 (-) Transcript_38099:1233-1688(-)|eukprot:XP_005826313.1 hypothetical protein GUITHDRAFT_114534 [Guillardia theta CCMP2712]
MGGNASVPQVRAKDVKRASDIKHGWLCKRGLTNTQLQRRWCAIHDLRLYYFENPRSEEPKGVVNLRGAIVSESKTIKLAIEIQTGALIADKGVEKRTYVFTTVGSDDKKMKGGEGMSKDERLRQQRKYDRENLEKWLKWLQEETAKTFAPS